MNTFRHRLSLIVGLFALVGIVISMNGWLKAPYKQWEARQLAQGFLDLLGAGEFEKAHELTLKNGYVGKTPKELEVVAKRESCASARLVETFPFQSNGNRLRRWFAGVQVDMDEVHVEFEGAGLLRITVRRTSQGEWKVFRFARHAG